MTTNTDPTTNPYLDAFAATNKAYRAIRDARRAKGLTVTEMLAAAEIDRIPQEAGGPGGRVPYYHDEIPALAAVLGIDPVTIAAAGVSRPDTLTSPEYDYDDDDEDYDDDGDEWDDDDEDGWL